MEKLVKSKVYIVRHYFNISTSRDSHNPYHMIGEVVVIDTKTNQRTYWEGDKCFTYGGAANDLIRPYFEGLGYTLNLWLSEHKNLYIDSSEVSMTTLKGIAKRNSEKASLQNA